MNLVLSNYEPVRTTSNKHDYRDWTGVFKSQNLINPLRPNSPTRRDAPHPPGMSIQRPYNSGNETFWIWNPPRRRIQERLPSPIRLYERVRNYGNRDISLHSSVWNVPRQVHNSVDFPILPPPPRNTRFGRRDLNPTLQGIVPGSNRNRLASNSVDFICYP
ncbi:Oidioi.mRNA.OKI2018_I69.PAR.g9988.t1.cds [Oikopleura dioica]|uniref:Oidioi.mRNA.OKI2018_I69.PAR.g9988.t1.cds n=1 Tax=Oikopleura dioica TaxID=34765 RepID=A0ABN7RU67_OIKDI|nr:Oidioi.mRNA.OKI2018_I69.PAR.g9988.t1.cds [Oikopleura dioica]